jgi:CRP-like cAMP-binding protein
MSSAAVADFLHANPVFASVPMRELQALAGVTRDTAYRAREAIFAEGEPALWFCVVRAGHVKIFRQARGGRDVVLELLGPGELFGGVAVLERRDYPASAQATEPSVVLKIPRDPIIAVSERHPSVIREMALMMGRRLRGAHESMASLATDPVEARLASILVRLADREGVPAAGGVALPALTRQSLADMAGTTVETTIRIVSRWLKTRVVTERDGHLVVPDLAALRALAGGDAT